MSSYTIQSKALNKNRVFILQKSELEGRLDPVFYKPEFRNLVNNKNIKFQRLGFFTNSIHHPPEYERVYSESGYQLLRAQNVKPLGIEIENNQVFFSEEKLLGKNLVFPKIGDVLVVRSGVNAGDTAVIENEYKKVIIGADNLLVKVNEKMLPKFLQVFFFTEIGKNLMSRYLTGATNKHINPENLSKILIPEIDKSNQEVAITIFEKFIELKKQHEAEAEKLLASIDDYLLAELGIILPEPPENNLKNRIFTTTLKEISGNRFDPYYNSKFFEYFYKSINSGKYKNSFLRKIAHISSGAIINTTEYLNEGIPLIRIQNIIPEGITFEDTKYISEELFNKNKTAQIKSGDLLFGMSGTIGRVAVAQDNLPLCVLNQRIAKVVVSNNVNVIYVQSVLNSSIGIYQFKRIGTGGIQINIGNNDIELIQIPVPPIEKQNEIAEHIKNIRQEAQTLKDEVKTDLENARREIEKIIFEN